MIGLTDTSDALAASLAGMVEAIAASPNVQELERRCLEEVRRFVPVPRLGLYVLDPTTQRAVHSAADGVSDYFLSRYEEIGRSKDPSCGTFSSIGSPRTTGL